MARWFYAMQQQDILSSRSFVWLEPARWALWGCRRPSGIWGKLVTACGYPDQGAGYRVWQGRSHGMVTARKVRQSASSMVPPSIPTTHCGFEKHPPPKQLPMPCLPHLTNVFCLFLCFWSMKMSMISQQMSFVFVCWLNDWQLSWRSTKVTLARR